MHGTECPYWDLVSLNLQVDSPPFAATVAAAAGLSSAIPGRPGLPPIGFNSEKGLQLFIFLSLPFFLSPWMFNSWHCCKTTLCETSGRREEVCTKYHNTSVPLSVCCLISLAVLCHVFSSYSPTHFLSPSLSLSALGKETIRALYCHIFAFLPPSLPSSLSPFPPLPIPSLLPSPSLSLLSPSSLPSPLCPWWWYTMACTQTLHAGELCTKSLLNLHPLCPHVQGDYARHYHHYCSNMGERGLTTLMWSGGL